MCGATQRFRSARVKPFPPSPSPGPTLETAGSQKPPICIDIVTTGGDFIETFNAPLSLDHSSGSQVSIIGDNVNHITLRFPNTGGLTLDNLHDFGTIQSIALIGGANGNGISAGTGAVYSNIGYCLISGFDTQVDLEQNSSLNFGSGIVMSNCLNNGIHLDASSLFVANGALNFVGNGAFGAGIAAQHGSRVVAQGSIFNSGGYGVIAYNDSVIDVTNSTFSNCGRDCGSFFNSSIIATGGSFSSTDVDLYAGYQGLIYANGVTGASMSTTNGGNIYTS